MKIGFDLDRVFINYPPLIPPSVIDWLYRKHFQKTLSYSIPRAPHSKAVRRIFHISVLRPNIKENINFIKQFIQKPHQYKFYLISSRYKFLEKLTHKRLKQMGLDKVFQAIYLNTKNRQPHLFKADVINKNKIELYIDDDLLLLKHLLKHCPKTKLLWYNPNHHKHYHNGITTIHHLDEILKFLH